MPHARHSICHPCFCPSLVPRGRAAGRQPKCSSEGCHVLPWQPVRAPGTQGPVRDDGNAGDAGDTGTRPSGLQSSDQGWGLTTETRPLRLLLPPERWLFGTTKTIPRSPLSQFRLPGHLLTHLFCFFPEGFETLPRKFYLALPRTRSFSPMIASLSPQTVSHCQKVSGAPLPQG